MVREEIKTEVLPELETVLSAPYGVMDSKTFAEIVARVRTKAEARVEDWLQTIEIRFGRDFHRVLRESFGIDLEQFGITGNVDGVLKELQRARDVFGLDRDTLQRKAFMDAIFKEGFPPICDHEQIFVMMLGKMHGLVVYFLFTDGGQMELSLFIETIND